jgi:hypothetical protein
MPREDVCDECGRCGNIALTTYIDTSDLLRSNYYRGELATPTSKHLCQTCGYWHLRATAHYLIGASEWFKFLSENLSENIGGTR